MDRRKFLGAAAIGAAGLLIAKTVKGRGVDRIVTTDLPEARYVELIKDGQAVGCVRRANLDTGEMEWVDRDWLKAFCARPLIHDFPVVRHKYIYPPYGQAQSERLPNEDEPGYERIPFVKTTFDKAVLRAYSPQWVKQKYPDLEVLSDARLTYS